MQAILFKAKKSEIHRRAKRLLNAFTNETRRESSVVGHRRLIRAHYEKGLLVLKEDFVKLPHVYGQSASLQIEIFDNLFGILKGELRKSRAHEFK